jgi:hypothetical protein
MTMNVQPDLTAAPEQSSPTPAPPAQQPEGDREQLDLWSGDQEERQAAVVRAVREGRVALDSGKSRHEPQTERN